MVADKTPITVIHDSASQLFPIVHYLFHWVKKNLNWVGIRKISNITPFHKSDSRSIIIKFIPIKILRKLSIDLERILFSFIYPKICHLIDCRPLGLMTKKSTVTQMIFYLDEIYLASDSAVLCFSV